MAETIKAAVTANAEERVEIFVPRGAANECQNLQIGVNGKMYLLPRGQKVKVPYEVAQEFWRMERAEIERDRSSESMKLSNVKL